MAKLCMGCMNPLPEGNTTCTVCGFDPAKDQNPAHCLPVTAALQGHYIVGRLMGEAGDHLLYLAYDRQLREPCFIQEFFPAGLCRRDTIGGVQPTEGCERAFEDYASQFRGTMRGLARMRELPAIVPVYDIFEENGTVYAVSDYCQGMTLTKKIKLAGGRIPWAEARPLFMSLLASLATLNDAGIHHLAVCPDNILIGADGKARLRNFSISAAHIDGTYLRADLKSGYAAPEQYDGNHHVGGISDVYGVAATLFRTVTGNEPPAGNARAKNSDDLFMSAEVAEELTQPVCVALFNALQVHPENRTATVAELRDQLSLTPTVSALVDEVEEDMERKNTARNKAGEKEGSAARLWIVFAVVLVALIAVAVIALQLLTGGKEPDPQPDNSDLPVYTTTTTRPTIGTDKAVVDNVVGLNYYDLRDAKLNGRLYVTIDHFEFSDKAAGTVLSQTPVAGEEVFTGTELKVVVSYGSEDESVIVPNLSGWKQEHAEAYLKALGFRVKTVFLQASDYEKGIVDSTDPVARTQKRLGDTITLRVSNVEPTTTTDSTTTTTDDSTTDDGTDNSTTDNGTDNSTTDNGTDNSTTNDGGETTTTNNSPFHN